MMDLTPLPLPGAFVVSFPRHGDERGHFERVFCRDSFTAAGLADCSRQNSLSYNARHGTLRGMHFQKAPHKETKLVRCVAGAVFDVIVDLRPHSATFASWHGVELSAENAQALYIPEGFAHGFVTLTDNALLLYQIADDYVPGAAEGLAWDDPDVAIDWPIEPTVVGAADRNRLSLTTLRPILLRDQP